MYVHIYIYMGIYLQIHLCLHVQLTLVYDSGSQRNRGGMWTLCGCSAEREVGGGCSRVGAPLTLTYYLDPKNTHIYIHDNGPEPLRRAQKASRCLLVSWGDGFLR